MKKKMQLVVNLNSFRLNNLGEREMVLKGELRQLVKERLQELIDNDEFEFEIEED